MSNLYHFLTDLALNPKPQMMFGENPEKIIEEAGLSAIAQSLLSRDRAKLSKAFADELETRELVAVMGNCFGSDPGPDPDPDSDDPFPDDPIPDDPIPDDDGNESE